MEKYKIDKERRMDGTKMLWHMDRVTDYLDKGKKIMPLYIDMGLTKACNMACIYCYGNYQKMTGEKIGRDALIRLFEEAPQIGIKGIGLVGDGEPTCNTAMYDAMDAGGKYGLDMAVSTNGLLLNTDKKLETILRNSTWFRFNLSAGNRDSYKKIHRVDGFDKLMKIVDRAVYLRDKHKYDCDIGFQSVFIPEIMMEDTLQESKIAVDKGIDYFVIKQCSMPTDDPNLQYQFDLNEYTQDEVIEMLKKAEAMSTEKTKIIPKWNLMQSKGVKPYEKCLAPPFLLQISGNGKVYPCGHLFPMGDGKQFLMGDIHEKGIEEICKSDRYWEVIDKVKKLNIHKFCTGNCRHDKVNEFLDDYTHPPRGLSFI